LQTCNFLAAETRRTP